MERRLDFKKYDKYGQVLTPGNVCLRLLKVENDRTMEFCVYKEGVTGGNSRGNYGRFITPTGVRSLKYSNIVFVFDTVSKRLGTTPEINEMIKQYYEGTK